MKNEDRANSKSAKRPDAESKTKSEKKSTKSSTTKRNSTGAERVSARGKSTDKSTTDRVGKSKTPSSKDKESKKSKQSSLEVSESKPGGLSQSSNSDFRPDKPLKNAETKPKYLCVKSSPVSKKLESSIVKFINENKSVKHYTNLSFGTNSILRIIDSKESEYFINLDNEYLMVDLEKNSVKNFGDIFECGIDTMMNIPWEDAE